MSKGKVVKLVKEKMREKEEKQRMISKKGESYLDRLNCILFEIQDDIKHAKKVNKVTVNKKEYNELYNLLVLLETFRSKSMQEQQFILDSLPAKEQQFLINL